MHDRYDLGPVKEFDEGHLQCDVAAARQEIAKMVDIADWKLREVVKEGMNPIQYLWQTVCDRIRRFVKPQRIFEGRL